MDEKKSFTLKDFMRENFDYKTNRKIQFKKSQILSFKAVPFPEEYLVIIGNFNYLNKFLKGKNLSLYKKDAYQIKNGICIGYCVASTTSNLYFIWIPLKTYDMTIIHEFSHLTDFLFQIHRIRNKKEKYQCFLGRHVGDFMYRIRNHYV